jgi:hypothetical protein
MPNIDDKDWLRKRLDTIIQLLIENGPGSASTTTSKIEKLLTMGFTQAEVAQVLGKKVNYVTAVVAGKKSPKAKQKTTPAASAAVLTRADEGDL